jgi:hypothetical protein
MSRILMMACLVLTLAPALPAAKATAADVSINLRIGDPYRGPRVVFEDEPDVVVVPGTRVYYIRDYDYDMYRYGSYWYYNYGGAWYRARRYNGPFVYVGYNSVPRPVAYVPARYRRHWDGPPGHAYGHYKDRGGPHDNGRGNGRYKDRGRDHDRGHGKGRH